MTSHIVTGFGDRLAGIVAYWRPRAANARDDYFAYSKQAYRLFCQLEKATDPHPRAELLYELADVELGMAELHMDAFGPDPIPDEGGRDLADSDALSALLIRLYADVEDAAAHGKPRALTDTRLEPHAGPILDCMAAEPDAERRGALLEPLFWAVVDVVGGQAAETIARMPAPGHPRPHSLMAHLRALFNR
jgi:hypothetical protein